MLCIGEALRLFNKHVYCAFHPYSSRSRLLTHLNSVRSCLIGQFIFRYKLNLVNMIWPPTHHATITD